MPRSSIHLHLIALLLFAGVTPIARGHDAGPVVRIACVGDSITEGTANADHMVNSWPRILGRLLEIEFPGQYETGNFGRSGATLLKHGHKPYWNEDVFAAGCAFEPQIVIINLGTNDAANRSWLEHGDEFEQDCRGLIDVYRTLDSKPVVWLSNLTPMTAPHPDAVGRAPHRDAIERIIAALADEYQLRVIDFKTPTTGRTALFPDGVHPNTAGNELMATAAFEALTDRAAPDDSTIRPHAVPGRPRTLIRAGHGLDVRPGPWTQGDTWVEGTGANNVLRAGVEIDAGDFHVRARLRMLGQENSAAHFALNDNVFGFEGARGTVFRNGPQMGGLRLLHPSVELWERDAWIDFDVIRNDGLVWFIVNGFIVDMAVIPGRISRVTFDPMRSRMQIRDWSIVGKTIARRPDHLVSRTVHTPWIDLSRRHELRTNADPAPESPATAIPSPDGRQLFRFSDARSPAGNTLAMTSDDDGRTWSRGFELPASLTGIGHRGVSLPDGRLLVAFYDMHASSPTRGDLVAWVGSYDDLAQQHEGVFTCRLLDNAEARDDRSSTSAEVTPDGIIRVTGRSRDGRTPPTDVTVQFTTEDLDALTPTRGYDIPLVDLDADAGRHVVVDHEPGQYLGHVTTVLLEDGKTILAVYPKGHGKGPITYKRSRDGGRTWSDRLPTPANWSTSQEVPTIHRVIDPASGARRLIMWSGLFPARLAVSENDGATWSELEAAGDWGGIVVMGFVERLANGSYLAMFHDDGRFIAAENRRSNPPVFTVYQTLSHDGGLRWTTPAIVWSGTDIHLCEPGCIRSPDGTTLAVLLRENSRTRNSYVIFSTDEGATWTAPRELPASLTGDRHTAKYAADGRLFVCFRDTTHDSPTQGDWVGWVGTWDDIALGRAGEYRVRIKDNKHRWDTTYPGVEVLPDDTFVVTTYGHWDDNQPPYILSARFTLAELDARASSE